jgi:hypothetical protein
VDPPHPAQCSCDPCLQRRTAEALRLTDGRAMQTLRSSRLLWQQAVLAQQQARRAMEQADLALEQLEKVQREIAAARQRSERDPPE